MGLPLPCTADKLKSTVLVKWFLVELLGRGARGGQCFVAALRAGRSALLLLETKCLDNVWTFIFPFLHLSDVEIQECNQFPKILNSFNFS